MNRNRIEIKKWLLDAGLTQAQMAREAGVSKSLVSMVVKGERRSPRVLQVLAAHGCPEEFFDRDYLGTRNCRP